MSKLSELVNELKETVKKFKGEPVAFNIQFALADGTNVEAVSDKETLEVDALINEIKAEGNTPLANGNYERDNGDLITVENGKITKILTAAELAEAAKGTEDADSVAEQLKAITEELAAVKAELEGQKVAMSAQTKAIEDEKKQLTEKESAMDKIIKLAEEVIQLSKDKPAAEPTEEPRKAASQSTPAQDWESRAQAFENAAKAKYNKL